jgi:hypothetical protein
MNFNQGQIFANKVFKKLKLNGWNMKLETIDPIGFCYIEFKEITIPERLFTEQHLDWETKQYILHEITHIFCPNDNHHGKEFHKKYSELIIKFMT